MDRKRINLRDRLFDVYCHYHKHTTKIIGAKELMCEKCQKEEFDLMMEKVRINAHKMGSLKQ